MPYIFGRYLQNQPLCMCDFALARKLRGARTVELSEAAATAEERLLCTMDKQVHNLDLIKTPWAPTKLQICLQHTPEKWDTTDYCLYLYIH